jgi:outer membrane protein OmpA-like peptidoglycan-associated protein
MRRPDSSHAGPPIALSLEAFSLAASVAAAILFGATAGVAQQRYGDTVFFDRAPSAAEIAEVFGGETGSRGHGRLTRSAGVSIQTATDVDPPTLPPRGPRTLSLAIQFDFDSDRLDSGDIAKLSHIGAFLAARPDIALLVGGHADARGDAIYNMGLSERRAVAVQRSLTLDRRIDPRRLVVAGFGEHRPLPGLSSYDPRNRRVEFRLLR